MVRVHTQVQVSGKAVADLAQWYKRVPKAWDGIHPRVIETALRLADGDVRRIVTDDQESLIVYAHRVW